MRDNMSVERASRPRPSTWYQTYFAAVLETDQKRAVLKISRAKAAIQERLEQLHAKPGEELNEVQDLQNALTYLSLLLQYFDPMQEGGRWD